MQNTVSFWLNKFLLWFFKRFVARLPGIDWLIDMAELDCHVLCNHSAIYQYRKIAALFQSLFQYSTEILRGIFFLYIFTIVWSLFWVNTCATKAFLYNKVVFVFAFRLTYFQWMFKCVDRFSTGAYQLADHITGTFTSIAKFKLWLSIPIIKDVEKSN